MVGERKCKWISEFELDVAAKGKLHYILDVKMKTLMSKIIE